MAYIVTAERIKTSDGAFHDRGETVELTETDAQSLLTQGAVVYGPNPPTQTSTPVPQPEA